MKSVITDSAYGKTKIPIKMWVDDLEETAFKQAVNLANLPFAFKHICLMPDAHSGYGMPIGGVMATKMVVVPNAVGVDIGCGMTAIKTNINNISDKNLRDIRDIIIERVPTGFNWHENPQDKNLMPDFSHCHDVVESEYENALHQIGTLGGGNHFIEIQTDNDGFVWAMAHSGSRNLGKKVADHYNKIAKEQNALWFSSVDHAADLAFLPFYPYGRSYMDEMEYCVKFAHNNRRLILDRTLKSIEDVCGAFAVRDRINIAHNYAAWENHFGQNVIVHRKGATRAYEGELGIIPGSQGSKSYIVRGLGNPMSFKSCSHGAGRQMGRKAAMQNLDIKKELKLMSGIVHGINGVEDLDEAPGAYKDIDAVMENQKDLVEILVELKPLAVVKG